MRTALSNRDEFDQCLVGTTQLVQQALQDEPGEPVLTAILNQLEAITQWTAGGRNVSRANKKRIIMGLQADRQLAHLPHVQEPLFALHNYIEGEMH